MTDQTPEQQLDALLAGIDNEKPCIVERNKPLAKALRHYLAKVKSGETRVPLEHLYVTQGMRELFNGPSMNSVRRWVQKEQAK